MRRQGLRLVSIFGIDIFFLQEEISVELVNLLLDLLVAKVELLVNTRVNFQVDQIEIRLDVHIIRLVVGQVGYLLRGQLFLDCRALAPPAITQEAGALLVEVFQVGIVVKQKL